MNATSAELLMRNFNEIFIELDPVKRRALLAESYTGKRDAGSTIRLHWNGLPRRA